MAPLKVHIKHAAKVYDVELDPDLPPNAFKENIYNITGVPPDRMKVMIKGVYLKEDTSWKKVAPKAGQTFMVVGAAGELPKPPEKPIVFLEDMDDAELAEALAKPVGLRNLGNTCYMNSSIQALRAIPELQTALTVPALQSDTPLPGALRELYQTMSKTSDTVTPITFLSTLRQVNPRFAEMDRREKAFMSGYAQQDAEECFSEIITTLRNIPGLSSEGTVLSEAEVATVRPKRFIDQFMMGEMRRELKCDEAPDEPPSVTHEPISKIECNITSETSYMHTGILNALNQKVQKRSQTLGREATYTQTSRVARLPGYLIVHMVRFAWKLDIGKKAKIMRKVKFPLEFDALDLATDELKARLLPVNQKLKEFERDRADRRKVRKKTKGPSATTSDSGGASTAPAPPTTVTSVDVEMGDSTVVVPALPPDAVAKAEREIDKEKVREAMAGGELEDESVYHAREKAEIESLINEDVRRDWGASVSGLYELVSIMTHKGPAADAGHYMGFVKKSVFHPAKPLDGKTAAAGGVTKAGWLIHGDNEDWYKFDDDKVSIFPKEKLATLDGGGEDSSAYLLIYKSKSL